MLSKGLMKKFLCLAVFLLSSAGCMQADTFINIKPDGSGTIEQVVMIAAEVTRQLEAMEKQMNPQKGENVNSAFNLFDEEKLKNSVSEFGEGVKYVSGEKINTDMFIGYKAKYSFDDINKVKINQNQEQNMPSSPEPANDGTIKEKKYIKFDFTKASPAVLTITFPKDETGNKEVKNEVKLENSDSTNVNSEEKSMQEQMMMEMMKNMFKGMRFSIVVNIEGKILQTNATHQSDSKITLLEMDFEKLINDAENFKKYALANPKTTEEAKKILKDVPGIKIDLNEKIEVKFQ